MTRSAPSSDTDAPINAEFDPQADSAVAGRVADVRASGGESGLASGIRTVWRFLRRVGLFEVGAILVFAVLVLTGITTSSIAHSHISVDGTVGAGVLEGHPRTVRVDEWRTYTPIYLGYMAAEGPGAFSPLAQPVDLIYQVPSSFGLESLIFLDGEMLKLGAWLPAEMVFAAHWWLPVLVLCLALPRLLIRLGSAHQPAYLATLLVIVAPSAAWWSMMPLRILAPTVLGGLLVLRGYDRLRRGSRWGFALCVLGGLLWSRMITYYVPWGIVLSVPIAAMVVLTLLIRPRLARRTGRAAALVAVGAMIVGMAAIVIANREALAAQLDTVYPGLRRSTGLAFPIGNVFGAPLLSDLQDDVSTGALFQSDLSQGFTVAFVIGVVIWISLPRRRWSFRAVAPSVLAAFVVLWITWSSVGWGKIGELLPIINRVPPLRAAQAVGLLAVIWLAFMLSRIPKQHPWRTSLVAGAAAGGLTAVAGASLARVYMPTVSTNEIAGASLLVAALALALVRWPRSRVVVTLVALAATVVVYRANPIQNGLSDLRESEAARWLYAQGESAREEGLYWASDDISVDPLLTANGVPQLSGNQVNGPVDEMWKKLDPSGQYREAWNRGVSYIRFTWSDNDVPEISVGPSRDVIMVRVDPCAVPDLGFDLEYIISTSPLPNSCLTSVHEFTWAGLPRTVYSLAASGDGDVGN